MITFEELLKLENMEGDLRQIHLNVENGKNTVVFGCDEGSRSQIASHLGGNLLYIVADKTLILKSVELLQSYFGEVGVVGLPEKDDLLIHRKTRNNKNAIERITALSKMAKGEVRACVTTAEALLQFVPQKKELLGRILTLNCGTNIAIDSVVEALVGLGYERLDEVEQRGTFSLAGDILSVYPIECELPYRISFFDEEIESIKCFQQDSRLSINEVSSITILPTSDFFVKESFFDGIEDTIRKKRKVLTTTADNRLDELLGEIFSKINDTAIGDELVWLTPFVRGGLSTISDYLPANTAVVFDDLRNVETKLKLYVTQHKSRVKNLAEQGEVMREHNAAIAEIEVELAKLFEGNRVLGFGNITSTTGLFTPEAVFNLKLSPLTAYHANYNALVSDLKGFLNAKSTVILCCGQKAIAETICESIKKEGIPATVTNLVKRGETGIFVTADGVKKGFNYSKNKLVVIGTDELVKRKFFKKTTSKKREVFSMPECGDFVVHDFHGIGLCVGIERIKGSFGEKDFVVIDYRDGKLYVPTDQMSALQRYGGSDKTPRLSKLGGQEFSQIKERVKQSIKEMAFDLLELYKKREKTVGHAYAPDGELQQLFEESFEFSETQDQLDSVCEIKADMESGKVMDRLLCGDVGYGKTEVALRAVFKTVVEGKQAAILAPTTILARQHYNTALARFSEFGIKCVLLSRFQSNEEIKTALKEIADARANVVIATHRLLSADVHFKDLGLLVLDEEQRFGVEHKEKIKLLKNNINVLTLSATPIPRTLNMALTGIRDISVLETPPESRIPVQTYVTELTDGLLSDVISRELARDGQVFVLYNRVQGIEKFAAKISELAVEANVIIAHGQMSADELEKNINAFYNKEANVLVCTTIIENGIDLPDANTLVVCEADKLGLSALYQLRGRVGRSNKLAHAYFTVKDNKVMTENGHKRLSAIMDYTDFGSGFKIAMRDLEIRGAGNVLGKEQHGHIAKVGYDMYCKLLQETIDEMNGEIVPRPSRVEVVCDVDAYLADGYVRNASSKLKLYKEIAEVKSKDEGEILLQSLKEMCGVVPKPVENLVEIALMKNLASMIGAKKIIINKQGAGIVFEDSSAFQNPNLMFAVSEMTGECVLTATKPPRVVFNAKFLTNEKKMKLMLKFLEKTSSNFK